MDPLSALVLAAAEMKIAAMPQFNAVVTALKELEEKFKTDLMAAEPDQIFGAQGRAQLARQIRQKFEDCLKLREDIKRRS
jgi:hypothetical protein